MAGRENLLATLFAPEPLRDALATVGRPCDIPALLRGHIPLNPQGVYSVRLCIDGLWRWIQVDDRVPADSYRGSPAYTSARGRQLWVPLLEKAAAKACGSYAGLAAGTLAEGLRLLTGAPVASLHVHTNETEEAQRQRHERERGGDFSLPASGWGGAATASNGGRVWGEWCFGQPQPPAIEDALWVRLCSWQSAGYLMGASCGAPSASNFPPALARAFGDSRAAWQRVCEAAEAAARGAGLHTSHAYSLLQLHQCPATGTRLLQLRNPHGKAEGSSGGSGSGGGGGGGGSSGGGWRGAWCDASPLWRSATPGIAALRAHCNPTQQAATGTFWMPLSDFTCCFHRLDVARVTQAAGGGGATSCARARLPLPNAGHPGITALRLTPTSTILVDCCITDCSSTLSEEGAAVVKYRRAGNEWPQRDLALLVVEELSRAEVLAEGSGGGRRGGGCAVGGAGAGAAAAAAAADLGEFGDGEEWSRARVPPYKAALAAAASGMRLISGPPRLLAHTADLQCWLEAGRTYTMLPLSLAGWDAAAPPAACIIELHYPSSKGLRLQVGSLPVPVFARALLCRTLSLGKASEWGKGEGGGSSSASSSFQSVHAVTHTDGAGMLLAAVNTHPVDSFELSSSVRDAAGMVLARGGGGCVDCVPPLTAQLVQAISPVPGAGGWSYASTMGVRMPAPRAAAQSPAAPAGTLHAPMPLVG